MNESIRQDLETVLERDMSSVTFFDWNEVTRALDRAHVEDPIWTMSVLVPWLERRLDELSWPDSVREVPGRWVQQIFDGERVERARVCRTFREMEGVEPYQTIHETNTIPSIRREHMRALVTSPDLAPYLTRVTFNGGIGSGASLDAQAVDVLVHEARFERLRRLSVGWGSIEDEFESLVAWPTFATLDALELDYAYIGRAGAELLANAPHAANLRELSIGHDAITTAGARALAASPHLKELERLTLSDGRLGNQALKHLLGPKSELRSLRALGLYHNGLGDSAMEALAKAPHLGGLEELDLRYNGFVSPGPFVDLMRAPHVASLKRLELDGAWYGPVGVRAITESACARSLEHLRIVSRDLRLDDETVLRLMSDAVMPSLRVLELHEDTLEGLGVATIHAVIDSPRVGRAGERSLAIANHLSAAMLCETPSH